MEKLQSFDTTGGDVKWLSCCGEHFVPQKVKHIITIGHSNARYIPIITENRYPEKYVYMCS